VTVLGETRAALAGGLLVVVDAARLLVRHFPALLTVFLLGLGARSAILWGAVLIGRDHALLASFLLPLAPLSMVVALVVMVRIAGVALVADQHDPSWSRRLAVLTSALVPFLAVYAVTGGLEADQRQFINESYVDEGQRNATDFVARTIVDVGQLQLVLLIAFLVVRLLIDILDLEERSTVWGVVQVLVEVTWLTLFATSLTKILGDARDWVSDLVVVARVQEGWQALTSWLGPLTDPLRWVSGLFSDTLERIGPIVVTPLLWLAVGAVVVVGGLPESRRGRAVEDRFAASLSPALDRLRKRRARAKLVELATRRFEDLVDGVKVLVHAGLLPVLVFCLLMPLTRLAEWGVGEALRALLGPRDPETMVAFSAYLGILTGAVQTLLTVVLVVAALHRLLLRDVEEETAEAAAQPVTSSST
jgi:hypothetical protein